MREEIAGSAPQKGGFRVIQNEVKRGTIIVHPKKRREDHSGSRKMGREGPKKGNKSL